MQTVKEIAAALHAARVTWGIGGEVLLYHNGIVFDFSVLDIFVLPQDFAAADAALSALGARSAQGYTIHAITCKLFTKFCVQDSSINYHYMFRQSSIAETAHAEVDLPYMALEDWYLFYALTEQKQKTQLLQRHFLFNGIGCPAVFIAALSDALPLSVKAELRALLQKDEQPKMWD